MKRSKPAFSIRLLPLLLMTGCGALSGEGDVKSSSYESFQEALSKGAIKSGWLPETLPHSAKNIVETHNIDSGEVWAKFQYSGDDVNQATKDCNKNESVVYPNAQRTKRNVSWWPLELSNNANDLSRKPWRVFRCPSSRHAENIYAANIAIDTKSQTAWYWIVK